MTYQIGKIVILSFATGLLLLGAVSADASSARRAADAEQERLNEVCESARQKILGPERAELIAQCVEDKFPRSDLAGCERFYADHGNAAGGRAPLYMDIPECLEAFEFRQGR